MKRNILLATVVAVMLTHAASAQDRLMQSAQGLFEPLPTEPPDIGIRSTPERIALGKMLYFDPRLSESHSISCNSCHLIGLGGVDLQETSIGHRWQHGARNAPTVLNAVFNTAQFWDGRAGTLDEQAGGPLVNPIEMGTTEEHVVLQLEGIPGYVDAFAKAFAEADQPVTFENIRDSIALFEATLITPNAPFDRYLRGDAQAMTDDQKTGLQLFIEKGCTGCHHGMNVGGNMYAPFGVVERPGAALLPPTDKGRFAVTKTVSDEYVFKVPSLRNIALTPPYFHSGRVWDLRQAVAVMGTSQLGTPLSDDEVVQITAFLHALTGDQPVMTLPLLPPSVAATPRPNP
ncbi:MAG TPA: cytochrome-c peroxidase [Hyphomicrobiaceae bacterium]